MAYAGMHNKISLISLNLRSTGTAWLKVLLLELPKLFYLQLQYFKRGQRVLQKHTFLKTPFIYTSNQTFNFARNFPCHNHTLCCGMTLGPLSLKSLQRAFETRREPWCFLMFSAIYWPKSHKHFWHLLKCSMVKWHLLIAGCYIEICSWTCPNSTFWQMTIKLKFNHW